jgi:fumarate reductase subunit C
MATKRKPYIREVGADWWKNHPYYRFYMLREGTAVFSIWVSVLLLIMLAAPSAFAGLVANPLVIILNAAALAASLLHTKTWFGLTPKALNWPEAKLAQVVTMLWAATAVVTAGALALYFI